MKTIKFAGIVTVVLAMSWAASSYATKLTVVSSKPTNDTATPARELEKPAPDAKPAVDIMGPSIDVTRPAHEFQRPLRELSPMPIADRKPMGKPSRASEHQNPRQPRQK